MDATITITYSTDNREVIQDTKNIIASILPYMVDNVEITSDVWE